VTLAESGAAASQVAARRVFLSLGSNLGDRLAFLRAARAALATLPQVDVLASSPIYETDPQDFEAQPAFLNQVICLETTLPPSDLLRACQAIEAAHGRERSRRFGPRTLDIDILFYEGVESDDPELTLPHPRAQQRAFVMVPLADVWRWSRGMPALDVSQRAAELAREQAVRQYSDE